MSVNSALRKIIEFEQTFIKGQRELGEAEVRFMVDLYYQLQELRKATANQTGSLKASGEPHTAIERLSKYMGALEELVRDRLVPFVRSSAPGLWMLSQTGVGPVLAANMLAHLDITRAQTAGAFWRFAGLDPTLQWEKGSRRPFNARLKTACWKLSDSWVKLGNRADAFYALIYRERKALEVERNESLMFSDQAAAKLEKYNIGKTTEAYKAYSVGKLPPAHLDQRARRYAVKLFLAHLHHVMFEDRYHEPPPKPYAIAHGGHAHYIGPPGWPLATTETRP